MMISSGSTLLRGVFNTEELAIKAADSPTFLGLKTLKNWHYVKKLPALSLIIFVTRLFFHHMIKRFLAVMKIMFYFPYLQHSKYLD